MSGKRPIFDHPTDPTLKFVPIGGKPGAGKLAVIDATDADVVGLYNWSFDKKKAGAIQISAWAGPGIATGRKITLHQLIAQLAGVTDAEAIEYADRNFLNNCRSNVRPATMVEVMQRSKFRAHNTSGYRGVTWVERRGGYWQAQIKVDRKHRTLGAFADPEDAARAYDRAALKFFGNGRARLNFPITDYFVIDGGRIVGAGPHLDSGDSAGIARELPGDPEKQLTA
jgi:hypothetical protein